jgi:hypothetical protein
MILHRIFKNGTIDKKGNRIDNFVGSRKVIKYSTADVTLYTTG